MTTRYLECHNHYVLDSHPVAGIQRSSKQTNNGVKAMQIKQAHEMYAVIPMKSKTVLPDEGFEPRLVDVASKWNGHPYNLMVYATPKTGAYAKHRVFAVCNCGRHVPFGRLRQHFKACKAV